MQIESREKEAKICLLCSSKDSFQNKKWFLVFFFGNRNESSVNYGYEIISPKKTTLEVPRFFTEMS